MTRLRMALGNFPNTTALKSGEVTVPGVDFDIVEVDPMIAAYRRMVREVEFDVSELAPTTYLLAKQYGAPFTALPVFLTRKFHHGDIQCGAKSGILEPKDLANRRIGIRAYTVTTALWVRGILAHEYGLDINSITWVVDDEEHVTEFKLPDNVEVAPKGTSLAKMLMAGELDAALGGPAGTGRSGPPKAGWSSGAISSVAQESTGDQPYSLIAEPIPADKAWYDKTGVYPMHALVVVKDEVLKANPGIADDLYNAFLKVKDQYVDEIATKGGSNATDNRHIEQSKIVGRDFLPYGVEANGKTLEALMQYAVEQKILKQPMPLESVFATVSS